LIVIFASFRTAHPRQRGRQAVGQAGATVLVFDAIDAELVVLAEQLDRVDLAGKLEPRPADLAGIFAAAVNEVLDGHLGERRRLRWRQPVDRRHRISAAEKGPYEIRHVCAGDAGEFLEDFRAVITTPCAASSASSAIRVAPTNRLAAALRVPARAR
jgi:hypothetical protein